MRGSGSHSEERVRLISRFMQRRAEGAIKKRRRKRDFLRISSNENDLGFFGLLKGLFFVEKDHGGTQLSILMWIGNDVANPAESDFSILEVHLDESIFS